MSPPARLPRCLRPNAPAHARRRPSLSSWRALLAAASLLVLAAAARAQEPIVPPVAPVPEQVLPTPGGGSIEGNLNLVAVQPDDLGPAYQDGPVAFRPHFLYRLLYAEGIDATLGHKANTFINTLAPGLLVDFGSHWTVDYTPSWNLYSDHDFEDTVDQTVYITATESVGDWSVLLNQSYVKSSQPLVETGVQTNEQDFITGVAIAHTLNQRFSVEADLNQFLRYAKGFPDDDDWSDVDWLNCTLTPELVAGVGVGLGYVKDSGQPDATYTNPQARLTWKPGTKLAISLDAGSEHREFYGHPKTGLTSPTYVGEIDYAILETTVFKATTSRQISDSYFINQTTKNTTWDVSLSQELLTNWKLSAGIGNDQMTYVSTQAGPQVVRHDNQFSYLLRLSWKVAPRATLALIFNDTRDRSSVADYGYASKQFGFEASYRY